MKQVEVIKEFKRIENYLFDKSNWQIMELTRTWAKSQPNEAGVYILFENNKPVYVGESGKLSGRILDMLNSRHHSVRRSIGLKRFSNIKGFRKATSQIKFPNEIEELVQSTMLSFKLSLIKLNIGRKEFEEYIIPKYKPEFNRKSKRTT